MNPQRLGPNAEDSRLGIHPLLFIHLNEIYPKCSFLPLSTSPQIASELMPFLKLLRSGHYALRIITQINLLGKMQ